LFGKTVLCNCDDPYESNFFLYFALNFAALVMSSFVAIKLDKLLQNSNKKESLV
jgi:hypothetical protein